MIRKKNIIGYFICPSCFGYLQKKKGATNKKKIYIFSLLSKNCYPRISRGLTIYTSRSVTHTYILLYMYIYIYVYTYIYIYIRAHQLPLFFRITLHSCSNMLLDELWKKKKKKVISKISTPPTLGLKIGKLPFKVKFSKLW